MKPTEGIRALDWKRTTNVEDADGIAALRAAIPDLKESLEIGSDPIPGRYPRKKHVNRYMDTLTGFGEAMSEFFTGCDDLHHQLMSAIAEGLGLPEDFFSDKVTQGDHVLRLLHYPAVSKSALAIDGAVRAGAHTDFGTVTLLFQDNSGGLQVQTPDGAYMDVPPIEDAIVINAGE